MNKNRNILLSILIPTKNRSNYILNCVKSLIEFDTDLIEIIVQDNSDENNTFEALKFYIDNKKIVYNHTSKPLKMVDNFTIALELSKGKYITFIGDDDTLIEDVIDVIKWANNNELEAVVSSCTPKYFWPDVNHVLYGKSFSSKLLLKHFTKDIIYPDPKTELNKCAKNSGKSLCKLPRAYHGVVKKDLFNSIKNKTGTYFPGPTPDMSSAVALATVINKYAHIDYPFFISGTGKNSGGGAGTEKKHDWNLNQIQWLSDSTINNWSNLMPYYASGTTIWSEGFLQAITLMNFKIDSDFNYPYLFARCILNESKYFKSIKEKIHLYSISKNVSLFSTWLKIIYYMNVYSIERMKALIDNYITLSNKVTSNYNDLSSRFLKISDNVNNIESASINLSGFLKINKCKLNNVISK